MAISPSWRKKLLALYELRLQGQMTDWESHAYNGKNSGFIENVYHFCVEGSEDLTVNQKRAIDKMVGRYITGDFNTVPAGESDSIPDEEIDPSTKAFNWGNGVTAQSGEDGWTIFINRIQAGFPVTLAHAKVIGDWLYRSLEYMLLAVRYTNKMHPVNNNPDEFETAEMADQANADGNAASAMDEAGRDAFNQDVNDPF